MHRGFIVTAALALACGTQESVPNPNPSDAAPGVLDAGNDASSVLTDAQVVGVLHAIDQVEIQEGELASASAVRPDVASFANQIVTDHASADAALTQPTADSALSLQLAARASRDLATLRRLTGPSFDAAYVTMQVANHQTALALVDMVLSAYSSNQAVLDRIVAARDLASGHLAHANALQQALAGGP